ncbi:MAG: hypothetical protein AABZ06_10125 [Bdellovibrionota bacterium]
MNISKLVAIVSLPLAFASCNGGGGGNSSTGGVVFTHDQLAREFVRRVNIDLVNYDLELVKINTLQYDYIVVYDHYYGTYDAYYIGDYEPGEYLGSYISRNQYRFYYDLVWEIDMGNYYYDTLTGTRFERATATSKNLTAMKALKEELVVNSAAERLQAQYGLSAGKAVDTARFAYRLQKAPAGTYNEKDYDAFSKELVGSSISEFQKDVQNNDMVSLNERVKLAAEKSGMGTEGVNRFMQDFMETGP